MASQDLITAGAARTAAATTVQTALDALTGALATWRASTAAMGAQASAAGVDKGAAAALASATPSLRALLWQLHAVCPAEFEDAMSGLHGNTPHTFAVTEAARVAGFLGQY